MKRVIIICFTLILFVSVCCQAQDILSYVKKTDTSFKWKKVSQNESSISSRYVLNMTSQTWQGIEWNHEIEIFKPAKPEYPQIASLYITFGKPGGDESKVAELLALNTGSPVAILYGIPNQPLFDGRREDDLIGYTLVKALETGDDTWPLLFPMTKSAVRAMDAIQAFSKSELKQEITGFIVSGASKRGWTTWLTAAADPVRVKGIIPMVYDNLNLSKQMPHQIDTWGSYSESISDYSSRGLQKALETRQGKLMGAAIDPWTYRDRVTMPKLIINGTNDDYWPLDALNLYWDGLKGPKSVLYIPNAGHGLDDLGRVSSAMSAFVRMIAASSSLPKMTWKYSIDKNQQKLDIKLNPENSKAFLWTATSNTKDFRKSRWESTPMNAIKDGFTTTIEAPTRGYKAVFGEVETTSAGKPHMLSTQVRILTSVRVGGRDRETYSLPE